MWTSIIHKETDKEQMHCTAGTERYNINIVRKRPILSVGTGTKDSLLCFSFQVKSGK